MTLRNRSFALLLALIGAFAAVSVDRAPVGAAAKSSIDGKVKSIGTYCRSVDLSRKKLTQRKETELQLSAEGSEVLFFSSGNELKKIEATMLGETYQDRIELCYRNNKLIFGFEKFARYEGNLTSPLRPAVLYRYYFDGPTLIRLTVNGKAIKPLAPGQEDTDGYWTHKDEFVSAAVELRGYFTSKSSSN
jgi:hypothetical protein